MRDEDATYILIDRARSGDTAALDTLLGDLRPRLRQAAGRKLGDRLAGRLDASDLVQQTLLEACRDIRRFGGSRPEDLWAWLLGILDHNMAEAVRTHALAQRRALCRERSLDDTGNAALRAGLPAERTSPSQQAARTQKALRLLAALDVLPEDQRDAVWLRHGEGHSLAEIAHRLQRSEAAAAGLIRRGLETLRRRCGYEE